MSQSLGWKHGCSMEVCDQCYLLGGYGSKEGDAFRKEKEDRIRAKMIAVKGNGNPDAMKALLTWTGITPEQKLSIEGQPDYEFLKERKKTWAKVLPTWEMAEAFVKSMLSKGITGKKVDLTIKGARHVSCFGTTLDGVRREDPCPSLMRGSNFYFCGACGCGEVEIARLGGEGYTKLDYPYLECPRKRNGFSNSEEGPPREFVQQWIKLNTEAGGMGDIIYFLWFAEGLRKQGVDVEFFAGRKPFKDLIQLAGHKLAKTAGGCWPENYDHICQQERHHDFGQTGRLEFRGKLLPIPTTAIRPTFTLGQEALEKAAKIKKGITRNGTRRMVTLFPLSYYNTRNWPRGHFVDLALRLEAIGIGALTMVEEGQQHWLTDSQPQFPHSMWGRTLEEIMAIMLASDLVICVSSGPSVIAATLGVPTLIMMGPESKCYEGMGDHVKVVQVSPDRCGCVDCSFDARRGFSNICDAGCRALMSITPTEMLREVYQWFTKLGDGVPMVYTGPAVRNEADVHPHVPLEKAELFKAEDSQSTEIEYLELLSALVRVQKPRLVLETGAWNGSGTLSMAMAMQRNGFGSVVSIEKDTVKAKCLAHKLDSYGLSGHVVVAEDVFNFIENYDGPQFEMVFIDTELEQRAQELQAMLDANMIAEGALIAIHDTSPLRIHRKTGLPDERTATFYEQFKKVLAHYPGLIPFDFPLSRGMILIRYKE